MHAAGARVCRAALPVGPRPGVHGARTQPCHRPRGWWAPQHRCMSCCAAAEQRPCCPCCTCGRSKTWRAVPRRHGVQPRLHRLLPGTPWPSLQAYTAGHHPDLDGAPVHRQLPHCWKRTQRCGARCSLAPAVKTLVHARANTRGCMTGACPPSTTTASPPSSGRPAGW